MRRFITYWLPPILWAAVILIASSDVFSSSNTVGWLERITGWLGHPLAPPAADVANHLIRKTAHLTEYGILSALAFRALRGERPRWSPRWAAGAIMLALVLASIDELHQTFVPSRSGAWQDVVLDTVGATLAQVVIRAVQVLLSLSS